MKLAQDKFLDHYRIYISTLLNNKPEDFRNYLSDKQKENWDIAAKNKAPIEIIDYAYFVKFARGFIIEEDKKKRHEDKNWDLSKLPTYFELLQDVRNKIAHTHYDKLSEDEVNAAWHHLKFIAHLSGLTDLLSELESIHQRQKTGRKLENKSENDIDKESLKFLKQFIEELKNNKEEIDERIKQANHEEQSHLKELVSQANEKIDELRKTKKEFEILINGKNKFKLSPKQIALLFFLVVISVLVLYQILVPSGDPPPDDTTKVFRPEWQDSSLEVSELFNLQRSLLTLHNDQNERLKEQLRTELFDKYFYSESKVYRSSKDGRNNVESFSGKEFLYRIAYTEEDILGIKIISNMLNHDNGKIHSMQFYIITPDEINKGQLQNELK
jgi:hypothetical protein